jgi:hypothetical protein
MSKRSQAHVTAAARPNSTPPVFTPAVVRVPKDFKFTDAQFSDLEREGRIKFSEKQKADLLTLTDFWIGDLRLRRTAWPEEFRRCFEKMERAFQKAAEACRLNEEVGSLERHLLHWAMETPIKNASAFPVTLAALEQQLQTVREGIVALKQCLPPDPGRQRPFDDERRIIFLAEIFEAAGGKAAAYQTAYAETGSMADTPFRRFAQLFYSLLPSDVDKRDSGGLDEALRQGVMARRSKQAP